MRNIYTYIAPVNKRDYGENRTCLKTNVPRGAINRERVEWKKSLPHCLHFRPSPLARARLCIMHGPHARRRTIYITRWCPRDDRNGARVSRVGGGMPKFPILREKSDIFSATDGCYPCYVRLVRRTRYRNEACKTSTNYAPIVDSN